MLKLFFDTDCDITPEIAKKYNAGLISMPYIVEDEIIFPYKDWEKYDAKAFFDGILRKKGIIPTTAALSEEEYRQYFEPEFEKGNDILYIHFSKVMSATFASCEAAVKKLLEKYPGRKFDMINTKGITLGSYVLAKTMGDLYLQGKSVEEIKAWAKENVDKQGFYFFADNLKFFAKSGRVSGFAAFMGGIVGVKPIICIKEDGKMNSIDKAIGRKKALEKIIQYVAELEDNMKDYPIVIAHGDSMYLVDEFTKMLRDKFGEDIKYEIIDINPTAGSHCGPDVLGITFHAKHR